jgi:hypothetical protein
MEIDHGADTAQKKGAEDGTQKVAPWLARKP